MTMFAVMVVKALVGLLFWGAAYGVAMLVMRMIPEGRAKALLGRPLRRGIRQRRWPVPLRKQP
jgi:hypothetical protein